MADKPDGRWIGFEGQAMTEPSRPPAADGASRNALRRHFGYDSFRPGQGELIEALLAGRDVLGVMPTGAGKSLCYQIPALVQDGLTLVISPLISLMKDQVGALRAAGIEAAYLNSSLSSAQQAEVLRRAAAGAYRLLYVAPERLDAPGFRQFLQSAGGGQSRPRIPLLAIDEAHCISHWGHDFRPSYLRIADLLDSLPVRPAVGAFTATATGRVRDDITSALGLRQPFVLVTGFNRENLHFAIKRPRDKDKTLLAYLRKRPGQSGIIYCATRRSVEEVCELLREQGIAATRYHAGLDEQERRGNQDDFLYDRSLVMVATNAFGMGIDKSNVAFVLHYNMPMNIEAYYQEAGRAGRDGSPADCTILYSGADVELNRFLIERSHAEQELQSLADNSNDSHDSHDSRPADAGESIAKLENDLELLRQMTFYCTTSDCLRAFILRYFGESYSPYCGNCGNCQAAFDEVDITIEAQKIVSCVIRVVRALEGTALSGMGQTTVCDILRGKDSEKLRRWRLDRLPTFSIMADVPLKRLRQIIDFLVYQGYLSLSLGKYPALLPGPRAAEIVRERRQLTIKLPRDTDRQPKLKGQEADVDAYPADSAAASVGAGLDAYSADGAAAGVGAGLDAYSADGAGDAGADAAAKAGATAAAGTDRPRHRTPSTATSAQASSTGHKPTDAEALSPSDAQLFEQLRALRARLAAEAEMPAYIVFSDASLRSICLMRPTTPDEFLEVNGVGTVKAERYGEAFLQAVREFESRQ